MKYGALPKHSTGGKDSWGSLQPLASLHFTVKSIHSSTSISEVQFWNTLASQNKYMKNHSGWTLLKGKTSQLLREGLWEQLNRWRKPELKFYIILLWKPQTGQAQTEHVTSFKAHKSKLLKNSRGSWVQENFSTHCSMPENLPDDHQSLKDAVLLSDYTISLSKDLFFSPSFFIFIKVCHKIQGWSSTLSLHIVFVFYE